MNVLFFVIYRCIRFWDWFEKSKGNLFPKGELRAPKAAVFLSFIYFIFLPVWNFPDYLECADSSVVIGIKNVVWKRRLKIFFWKVNKTHPNESDICIVLFDHEKNRQHHGAKILGYEEGVKSRILVLFVRLLNTVSAK